MKKYLSIIVSFFIIFTSLTGCGGGVKTTDVSKPAEGVDLDLAALSSVMIYAEMNNIKAAPDSYLGKTIRARGTYSAFYAEETGRYHQFIITYLDPTACCTELIEFSWKGSHKYPDDYPAEGAKIELTGVLEAYAVPGQILYRLAVDDITVL